MPKMRGFKPEIWTDEKFIELQPLARLLFMGMWNYACDNGHVEDKPKQIKMRILPADDCDVSELLSEIADQKMITRRKGVISIPNLGQHQRLDKRYFTTCEHCSPDGDTTGARSGHVVDTTGPRVEGRKEGEKKEGERRSRGESQIEADFDDWYARYPRKRGKGQALKAYKAARKKVDHDTLVAALKQQLPALTAKGDEFVPYPATWLNGERWDDDLGTPSNVTQLPDGRVELPPLPKGVFE